MTQHARASQTSASADEITCASVTDYKLLSSLCDCVDFIDFENTEIVKIVFLSFQLQLSSDCLPWLGEAD